MILRFDFCNVRWMNKVRSKLQILYTFFSFGFGVMSGEDMVDAAQSWINVPASRQCSVDFMQKGKDHIS